MTYQGQVWVPPVATTFGGQIGGGFASPVSISNAIVMDCPAQTSYAHEINSQYIISPSTPFCCIANISCNIGDYTGASSPGTMRFGLGFVANSGAIEWINASWSGTKTMGLYVSEGSYSGAVTDLVGTADASGWPTGNISWFQVRDDGTNFYFYVATDAGRGQPKHWVKVYQNSRTAYFTPFAVFWGGDAVQSAVANTYLTLNSFQLVSL